MEKLQEYKGVKVGDQLSQRTQMVTQEQVNTYAVVSHDYNPLHTDEEFAKTTFFGRTIAHGMLSVGILSQIMTEFHPRGWLHGGSGLPSAQHPQVRARPPHAPLGGRVGGDRQGGRREGGSELWSEGGSKGGCDGMSS